MGGYGKTFRRILELGVLAPSFCNSQPWKFSVDARGGVLEILADPERARPAELDPQGRDLYRALGFCLENMVLAAGALGYGLKEEIFPGGPSGPVARLRLEALPEAEASTLFPSLLIRQTHAGPYREGGVEEIHLNRLRALEPSSPQEGMHLLTEKNGRDRLERFLHDLSHQGAESQSLVEEVGRWLSPAKEPLEGISLAHVGLPVSSRVRFAFLRFADYRREIREAARQALLRQGHGVEAPAFLLMTTQNPSPRGFLAAGRWHARLDLTLSQMELAVQDLHLPVTLEPGRSFLKEIFRVGGGEAPLLLLRFGPPRKKSWPRTFRRPLGEVILPSGSAGPGKIKRP